MTNDEKINLDEVLSSFYEHLEKEQCSLSNIHRLSKAIVKAIQINMEKATLDDLNRAINIVSRCLNSQK